MGVWYMSHSKVRGTDENGNPYKREETLAAENAKHQNLHTKLAKKTEYTIENTRPVVIKTSNYPDVGGPGCHTTVEGNSCTISGGKKSRKSHNSKKSRKSKRSHTTYKRSKRSRR